MHRTLTFARLDYLTVKPYLTVKNLILFTVVFAFIGFGTGEPYASIGMMMMYGLIYATYPFAVGDKNGIDTLYATIPVTKKDIVVGRYVFVLLWQLMISAVAFAVSLALTAAQGRALAFVELIAAIIVCFLIFTFFGAIQLPFYFKLGYAKAKFFAYLPLAAFPAAVAALVALTDRDQFLSALYGIFSWAEANVILTVVMILLLWLALMAASCAVSYRFYRKREF